MALVVPMCHASQGYIEYIETGAVDGRWLYNPTSLSCTTCHSQHTSFDFVNDGYDYALRNIDPVTLVIDNATMIDFEGSSNNCITCHQPRNSYAIPGPTGDYTITSTRFGPHHGPQSPMLEGIMRRQYSAVQKLYPAVGSAAHRTGSSCTACHMAESSDGVHGLHTFIIYEESCKQCHTSGVPTKA
ncbi:MAG: hypothetical protein U5K51_12860 [Flavobacteriaceae bacterium]|nr:hypothetical protein [Flavobacteriaceae bacterium]